MGGGKNYGGREELWGGGRIMRGGMNYGGWDELWGEG